MKITRKAFVEILKNLGKQNTFVSIHTATPVKMRKTGNPYAEVGIIKHARQNVQIGSEYAKRVGNEMGREGITEEWKPEAHLFADHIAPAVLKNRKDGTLYLQSYMFVNSIVEKVYTFKGDFIDLNLFEQYVQKSNGSAKQQEAGIKKEVVTIAPKIDNIVEATVNGVHYELEGLAEEA